MVPEQSPKAGDAQNSEQTCICCQKLWVPKSFNFFGLCEDCFPRWQAVRRMKPPPGTYRSVTPGYYSHTQFADWVAAGFPPPPDRPYEIEWA